MSALLRVGIKISRFCRFAGGFVCVAGAWFDFVSDKILLQNLFSKFIPSPSTSKRSESSVKGPLLFFQAIRLRNLPRVMLNLQ